MTFDLDPTAPLAKQVEQVLSATAAGQISTDVAKQIIDAISALGAIRQTEEFEARLARLEAVV